LITFITAHYIDWLDKKLAPYKKILSEHEEDTPKYNVAYAIYQKKRNKVWRLSRWFTNRYDFFYYDYLEARK